MERSWVAVAVSVVLVTVGPPATAVPPEQWSPPVDGPVVRGYEPPTRPFGPRHLGLDFAVPPGTPVRAAGDGVVVFAGLVGRARAVAVEHPGGRRTTYAYLRWVVVRPPGGGPALVLARAANPEQMARVGDQTGGRVFLFLRTDDFWRDHRDMMSHGVRFVEGPRDEPYGTVAVFLDLYGNRWDLVQPRP